MTNQKYTGYKIRFDKSIEWYKNDKLHKIDGPAIEYVDGSKEWYQKGLRHRLDGPAIAYASGSKHWYQDDKLHRINGPAIERVNGDICWYINNIQLTEEEFDQHSLVIEYKNSRKQ